MRVSSEREITKIFERLESPGGVNLTGSCIAPKDLRYFDIEKMGRLKRFVAVEQPIGRVYSDGSVEQHSMAVEASTTITGLLVRL